MFGFIAKLFGRNKSVLGERTEVAEITTITDIEEAPQVDQWVEFKETTLSEKETWAKMINVDEVARQSDSTPEKVECVAGYPTLWLEFAELVGRETKPGLDEVLTFGLRIRGNSQAMWNGYRKYLSSPVGFGKIHPREYYNLDKDKLNLLDVVIGINNNVAAYLDSYTLDEFILYAPIATEKLWSWYDEGHFVDPHRNFRRVFYNRLETLIDARWKECGNLEELVELYPTLPDKIILFGRGCRWGRDEFDISDLYYDFREKVCEKIYEKIRLKMKNASTVITLEKIEIPDCLEDYKKETLESVRRQCLLDLERARIQAALGQSAS